MANIIRYIAFFCLISFLSTAILIACFYKGNIPMFWNGARQKYINNAVKDDFGYKFDEKNKSISIAGCKGSVCFVNSSHKDAWPKDIEYYPSNESGNYRMSVVDNEGSIVAVLEINGNVSSKKILFYDVEDVIIVSSDLCKNRLNIIKTGEGCVIEIPAHIEKTPLIIRLQVKRSVAGGSNEYKSDEGPEK